MFEEILTFTLNTEKGRQLGLATLIFFSLLFFYSTIHAISNWHSDIVLTPSRLRDVMHQSDEAQQLIVQIPNQHLFGQSMEEADFPISSLQLRLAGTVKMSEESLSRAMISSGGDASKVYRVGDELVSGIKIYAINTNNVVLESHGHLEKLPLSRQTLAFQAAPASLWQD